jgi:formylglycine-generating enzyme required for sulfatase activity
MGSPETEPGRTALNEPFHRKEITRSFVIANKEVTMEQFLRFKPKYVWEKRYCPDLAGPAIKVSWFVAAEYCNWLSEREGFSEDQWCYEPNRDGLYDTEMRMKTDHLKRGGYRLPTDAEWEYTCRSGSAVARSFGRSEELLPRYGWYIKCGEDHTWAVGRLRPNDLGLFDMLGNAAEWVEDPGVRYIPGQRDEIENKGVQVILNTPQRIFRGGSFYDLPGYVRSARRNGLIPANPVPSSGFRPCRTLIN